MVNYTARHLMLYVIIVPIHSLFYAAQGVRLSKVKTTRSTRFFLSNFLALSLSARFYVILTNPFENGWMLII